MSTFKKRRLHRYLDKIPVYNVEHGTTTSTYFNLRNMSEYFMLGKNSFFIGGTPKLVPGSEVLMEATDAVGNIIYTEFPGYSEDASVLASAYIYDDTASGLCTLILLGIANDVPDKWKNKINTKWISRIYVDPTRINRDPLRFIDIPSASFSVAGRTFYTTSIELESFQNSSSLTIDNYNLYSDVDIFDGTMEGGTITATAVHPRDMYSAGMLHWTWNANFSATLLQVISPKQAKLSQTFVANVYNNTISAPGIIPVTSGSINYHITTYIPTYVTASVITVDAINLNTYTGKVDKIYVYKRSFSKLEDFSLHSVVNVKEINLLSVDSPFSVDPIDIGKFTNDIIRTYWQPYRQMVSDGSTGDKILMGMPATDPGNIYYINEGAKIIISSSIGFTSSQSDYNFIESYMATKNPVPHYITISGSTVLAPISGSFQFSGSSTCPPITSAMSLIDVINSSSIYFTASYGFSTGFDTLPRANVTLAIKDNVTGSFETFIVTQSGQSNIVPFRITNAEIYIGIIPIQLNSNFPIASTTPPHTSSGYFSNAVQLSESYYSTHLYGEDIGTSIADYRYKVFVPTITMSLYSNSEYVHSAYIAGVGELEVRVVGSAILPDDIAAPDLGRLIGHYSNTGVVNYGQQYNAFTPDSYGNVTVKYVVKSGIWDVARSFLGLNTAAGYSSNRLLFNFPIVPLTDKEVFQFKLMFANPINLTNVVEIISQELVCPGISLTGGGAGGAITVPIVQRGAVIYSTGYKWIAALPMTGQGTGWLVNDQGILLVQELS